MGRDRRNEQRVDHFSKMIRNMMEEPAWAALPSSAQALYPWLKLEWRGPKSNNNGKIRLSVRQAANRMGVTPNTANRAFQALLAKGFLVITVPARLGLGGEAKSPAYELTELGCAMGNDHGGQKLYRKWRPGKDRQVDKAMVNNPTGLNGKAKPCRQKKDGAVTSLKTSRQRSSSI